MFACNGILFNHESPRRGETFVTQKNCSGYVQNKTKKKQKTLYLGNLYAKRDWGHARDFVHAMWLIMQRKDPKDFVIATGKQTTVKNFVNLVAKKLKIKLTWKGRGIKEKAIDQKGQILVACDKAYFRPLEVNNLLGDSSRARKILNWKPKTSIKRACI